MVFVMSAGMSLSASSPERKENKTEVPAHVLPSLSLGGLPEVWLQGTPVREWEKDKVYIFEFWATWCGPCLAVMPHMEQLYQAFKDNPRFQIIGINVMDNKTPEALKTFLKNRPISLNYAMAVDVKGKKTKAEWLDPLGVEGIPEAFAVKNGKLIWRGHPVKLTEEMLQAMLKPDFSAASLPGEDADAGRREWKRYRQTAETVQRLVRTEGKAAAEQFLKQVQASGQLSPDRLLQLRMFLFESLGKLGQFDEAQSVLNDLSREHQDNYRVQINIAGNLLDRDIMPADKLQPDLVERCLDRCIEISKKDNKEASLPWRMMAELREREGKNREALECMEKSISLSSLGKAWARLQQQSGTGEPLSSVLDRVIKDLKPEPARKTQEMGKVQEDHVYTPLFNKLTWFNHSGLAGLPPGKTVFISFWRGVLRQGRPWGEGAPGSALDLVLKKYGLLDDPGIKVVVLTVRPLDQKAAETCLARPEMWSPYPVGLPSDNSVADLFNSLKLDAFPAVAVIRDGTLLWAGEVARIPGWVMEIARRDSFDKNQFAEEAAQHQVYRKKMQEVLGKSLQLRKQKKYEEYKKLLEEHASRFKDNGWFSFSVAEISAGKALEEKDYRKTVDIFDQLLERFPQDDSLASYILKILGNSDEMRAHSYKAARHALQIMRNANIRGDGGYNAACYEVMMNMAIDKKDYVQAEKDALNAFRDLPLVHQYAAMKKKRGDV